MMNRLITLFIIRSVSKSLSKSPNNDGDGILSGLYLLLGRQLFRPRDKGENPQ